MSSLGATVATTSYGRWAWPVIERYADGSSSWIARLGAVIVSVHWRRD